MATEAGSFTVLVGIDDSTGAECALRWADHLITTRREAGGAADGLVIATWSPPAVDLRFGADNARLESAADELVERRVAKLDSAGAFRTRAIRGHAADVLLDEAARVGADLIVVGSRGRGAVAQVLLGSVSRQVAARSAIPVAVVPQGDEPPGSTIVVAFDASPGSRAALRWALDNTTEPIKAVMAWSRETTFLYDAEDPETVALEQATKAAVVDGVRDVCGGAIDPRVEPIATHGDPRLVALDPKLDANLVVMGQRSHRGFSGAMLGSTATYVAGNATVPVIIVPMSDAESEGS